MLSATMANRVACIFNWTGKGQKISYFITDLAFLIMDVEDFIKILTYILTGIFLTMEGA